MEESEKINGKKRLPSIPSNYVTLRQLQERWIKEKELKQKGEEEKEEPPQQEGKEAKVGERVHDDQVARGGSRKNGHFRRYNRGNGKLVAERKLREEKIAVGFAVEGGEDVDNVKKGEDLKNESKKKKKKKNRKNKKKNKEDEKARADNEGEEVLAPAGNAPPPASTENNNKGEEEVIGDEVQAVNQATVEVRRESQQRFVPRTHGSTVEIDLKFRAMSMKGEIRTGDYRRYGRQDGNLNYRGGNPELNRRYYGKFDRRREQQNQRNEGMVWVKKGEVSDRNVNGIQSSSYSSKELD